MLHQKPANSDGRTASNSAPSVITDESDRAVSVVRPTSPETRHSFMGFEQTNTTTTNGDKVKKPKRDKKGRHSTTASPRGSIVKPNKKKKNGQKADSFNQGEIKDPLIQKLLDAVNNENEKELSDCLNEETREMERIRNADIHGGSLLHYAASRCNAAIVAVLLQYGFDVNRKTNKLMEFYLEAHDYVSKFRPGSTPLYIATVAGNATIVTLLAKNGGNPNTADLEGYTPLHNAAWHNKLELIRYLISYGAKINVQESTGSTPLRKAAYRGHLEAAKMLLANGADPNIQTKRGRAAIHCAALYGHSEVLATLIQNGANVDIRDNDDMTPLHAAVYNGKRLAVRLLLKAKADVNAETKFGNTPLHLASMEKWYVIASLLVQGGADPEKKNRFGETPFSIMEMGNAGKRICVLSNKNKLLPMAELEKLEAEGREDLNLSGYILDGYNPLAEVHSNSNNIGATVMR